MTIHVVFCDDDIDDDRTMVILHKTFVVVLFTVREQSRRAWWKQ